MTDFTKILKKLKNFPADYICTTKCPFCEKVIERQEFLCGNCRKKLPETPLERYTVGKFKCVSPLPYAGEYKKAIKSFKFHSNAVYARQLAYLTALSINEVFQDEHFDLITCVPMHKKDRKRRGYNQSELLAAECSELLNIKYANLLEKYKRNKPQHKLNAKERQNNVRGVFRISDKNLVYGKNILIIDDIITTGNTLGKCAAILAGAGCKSVHCAAVCSVIS